MTNLEKYNQAFIENFEVTEDQLPGLKYQDVEAWDSVGHMGLIASLEEAFDRFDFVYTVAGFNIHDYGSPALRHYEVTSKVARYYQYS